MYVRTHRKFLWLLWLLAFVVRASVFLFYLGNNENYWQVDSNTYHKIAIGISEGKGISLPNGKPQFYRVPGYPIFLSLCYKVFGANKVAVLWVQMVIASLIPLIIFFIALTLFPSRVLLAKVVSLLSCFHMGFVLYAGFFMTESLFILFFLLFILLLFRAQKSIWLWGRDLEKNVLGRTNFIYSVDDYLGEAFIKFNDQAYADAGLSLTSLVEGDSRYRRLYMLLAGAGVSLGIASLIRPVGHYLIVLMVLMLLFLGKNSFREKCRQSCVMFIGWLFPVSFWLLRNYILLGYVFFHTLPGGHFLHLSAARVAMHIYDTSYQDARVLLQKEVDLAIDKKSEKRGGDLNEIERCHVHEAVAVKYFKMRPLLTLKNWMTDIFRASFSLYSAEILYLESGRKQYDYFNKKRTFWSMFERYLFPQTPSLLLRFLVWLEIVFFLFLLMGFLGAAFSFVQSLFTKGFLLSGVFFFESFLFVGLFLVISLSGGYARMRLPIECFLLVYSALFFYERLKLADEQ